MSRQLYVGFRGKRNASGILARAISKEAVLLTNSADKPFSSTCRQRLTRLSSQRYAQHFRLKQIRPPILNKVFILFNLQSSKNRIALQSPFTTTNAILSIANMLARRVFMDYIERMIATREDADETQRQLAAAIGVNHIQWAKYESGKNEPPIKYLQRFCAHYGVSADYILGLPKGLQWPR